MTIPEEHYRRALQGIASCATKCPCCEMHKAMAEEALALPAVDPAAAASINAAIDSMI